MLPMGSQVIFKAIWPHILLIVLLAVYILCGAYAFVYLEKATEMRLKSEGVKMVEQEKLRLQKFIWSSLIANSISFTNENNLTLSDIMYTNENSTHRTVPNVSVENDQELRWRNQFDKAFMDYNRVLLRAMKENFIEHSSLFEEDKKQYELWNLPAAVLFAFSAVTTIGYGNIAPITFNGRLFCMFYGLVGIPFAMLVLANVGKFLSEGLRYLISRGKRVLKRFRRRSTILTSKPDPNSAKINHGSSISDIDDLDPDEEEIDQPLPFACLICLVFGYMCLGAVLLPIWEPFTFFDAFYFNFITITTTGLGDLVPQRYKFYAITLTYIAVGIAMTTMCIESAAAYMRKLHYLGRRIQGAKFTRIRFGDKMITVDELVTSLGVRFAVPAVEITRLITKMDAFVATAIEIKDMDQEKKVQVLANFDQKSIASEQTPNGDSPLRLSQEKDNHKKTPIVGSSFLDLTAPLWRLLGAFNVSAEDIRYIDEDIFENDV